jgi:hypothetical protein
MKAGAEAIILMSFRPRDFARRERDAVYIRSAQDASQLRMMHGD